MKKTQAGKGGATAPPAGERKKTRPDYAAVIRFRCPVAMEDFLTLEAGKTARDRSDVAREVFQAGMAVLARRAVAKPRRQARAS